MNWTELFVFFGGLFGGAFHMRLFLRDRYKLLPKSWTPPVPHLSAEIICLGCNSVLFAGPLKAAENGKPVRVTVNPAHPCETDHAAAPQLMELCPHFADGFDQETYCEFCKKCPLCCTCGGATRVGGG